MSVCHEVESLHQLLNVVSAFIQSGADLQEPVMVRNFVESKMKDKTVTVLDILDFLESIKFRVQCVEELNVKALYSMRWNYFLDLFIEIFSEKEIANNFGKIKNLYLLNKPKDYYDPIEHCPVLTTDDYEEAVLMPDGTYLMEENECAPVFDSFDL
ncbi:hypothetical protein TVAG_050800 [Trichomonas vaginalis G3]|uniref:Uncharacterized protein n=1 Tax=Trichomonas vaginalis (strain ATCC PRA-98 / G3) TaxID=412133 RepID=A2EEP0_TRIV3|nr:hypothetical protein TVAGG3_0981640 [Trichomonas vaginalis G3]EAY08846.1 hypothetical protein TVAG_050800 [Trichomonas vaginalis G3]KAI5489341.1 hypothetical protein TVAGG3_0981640 [Trichomonas vaginalis G3]|eukprot:XP_001321069.1 hypothetical protein [Trichomonas vaginalis G3]